MGFNVRTLSFVVAMSLVLTCVSSTALDDYVNAPDSFYDYSILEDYTRRVDGQYTTYVVNMTSQKWLNENLVSRSIWWHYLAITIPDAIVYSDVGLLYMTGSNNEASPPDPLENSEILLASTAAVDVGIVTGCLFQVPNQPIVFSEDPKNKSRSEDSIIAYTWNHFLTVEGGTNQPEYLALLPMVKSGVRALDTMADWSHKIRPEITLTRFLPTGGSKRGWTAWLMGAVDKRVFAMAPIVLDILNAIENLRHHYSCLAGWTWAFNPYYEEGITSQLDNPDSQLIVQAIDPFEYRDRLTMPKYVITASNDEFFLVDDSHYYFDKMLGPIYMRIVANAEHALIGHREDIWKGIAAFGVAVLENYTMPTLSWERYENASHAVIILKTDTTPTNINAWHSNSLGDGRRDWRLLVASEPGSSSPVPHLAFYRSFAVRNPICHMCKLMQNSFGSSVHTMPWKAPGEYWAEFRRPWELWEAFFIEATFPGPNGRELKFTTEANITPDGSYAAPTCYGDGCIGDLI